MTFWDTLGIEPSDDINVIKRAYAARLRVTRPDDDAEAYQRLRQAYEYAQRHVARGVPSKTTANFTAQILTVKQGLVKQTGEPQEPAQTPESDEQVVVVVTASPAPVEPAGDVAAEPSSGAETGGETNSEKQNLEQSLAGRPKQTEQLPQPPRRPLLIHHKSEQPREDQPEKIVLSPASLVQATLQIWREHGAEKLLSRWPALQRELNELPLGSRATSSSLFAQLVIENDLPAGFVARLAKYFEWQTDFKVEQALGPHRAHLLGNKLAYGTTLASRATSLPARPLHVLLFIKLIGSRPGWWLWIFSALAGAQLPGQFLSMSDDERDFLDISKKSRAEALVWLQRGMLTRACLVVLVLAWSWSYDHTLLGPGQPANLVLYALPLAFAVFYLQVGLGTELQRRWSWPLKRAEQIACCLAIVPALMAQVLRVFDLASASWSARITPWSVLATVLLVAAAVVAPPPSRQDTNQMRLPIQFVLTFLVCLLILSAFRPGASALILVVYGSAWLAANILIYEPSRRWMVGVHARLKRSSPGRIVLALALCFAFALALPAFPSLLKEVARRTSQRLVFAAIALALFMPDHTPLSVTVTTRFLLFAVGLMLINNWLRGYAFTTMADTKRIRFWWRNRVAPTIGLLAFVVVTVALISLIPPTTTDTAPARAVAVAKPLAPITFRVSVRAVADHPDMLDQVSDTAALQTQLEKSIGRMAVASGTTMSCQIEYRADGSINNYSVLEGSGDLHLDQAVRTAILSTAPLLMIANTATGRPPRRYNVLLQAR